MLLSMPARYVDWPGRGALLVLGLAGCISARARADDERLVLMREPTPYTDVIDAAEPHDRFDLNAHLGYERSVDRGVIQREHTEQGERRRSSVANSEHKRSQLMLGVDVGLWKDMMAFARVPLVLSDDRSVSLLSGQQAARGGTLLTDPGDFGGGSSTLFSLPTDSPTRAGFDYLGLGGAVALTNQERKPWLPTWLVSVEGRRAIGGLMRPCKVGDNGPVCGMPSGQDGDFSASLPASSGVSRGVSAFALETRVSKRFRYFEPYAGLGALVEWASSARKFFQPGGDLKGYAQKAPGRQIMATLGTEFIPWEHKGRFQRVAIDARLGATYFTRGRDYSVLYDALGTSSHGALARPNYEGVRSFDAEADADAQRSVCSDANDSDCYVGKRVPFNGLTDVGSRVRYGGRLGLDIRAARYVRFAFGTGLQWVTSHTLTGADACNGDENSGARSTSTTGSSCDGHPSNPAHRPTIDLPGRRFWMTSEFIFDVYASATAQF